MQSGLFALNESLPNFLITTGCLLEIYLNDMTEEIAQRVGHWPCMPPTQFPSPVSQPVF